MPNTDIIILSTILALVAVMAIAALILAVDDDRITNNYFVFRKSGGGFYSMYEATNVSSLGVPISMLGGHAIGSNQLPANAMRPGSSIWITANGAFTTAGDPAQSVQVFCNLAPNVDVNIGPFSAGTYPWSLQMRLTCINEQNITADITVFTTLLPFTTWTNSGSAGFITKDKQTVDMDVRFAVTDPGTEIWTTLSLQEGFSLR